MHAFLWVMFLIGQLVNIIKRADLSASSKATPWNSVVEFVVWHWPSLLARLFIASMLFGMWWSNPEHIVYVLGDYAKWLPLNPFTSGLYGFFSDSIVDYGITKISSRIPQLARDVPPVPRP